MALRNPSYLATRDYSAMEDRIAMLLGSNGMGAGVYNFGDLAVTQRASSANMSVDVASGWGIIPANNAGNSGIYALQNDAVVNVPLAASHASLPRVDQIVLTVNDSTDGGASTDIPELSVLTGTPTAGANLTNRTGAVDPLPNNTIRLADVLVGAGVTTIANANIVDRRARARGYRNSIYLPASVNTSSATFTRITSLDTTFESTGRPVEVTFTAAFSVNLNTSAIAVGASIDGVLPGGTWEGRSWVAGAGNTLSFTQVMFTTAGRRTFGVMWNVSNGTLATMFSANFTVKELTQ